MRIWHRWLMIVLFAWAGAARAAEVIPPLPVNYFNDYAGVAPQAAADLNTKLEDFERESSDEVRVVVYPKMQSDASVADYTVRVFNAWGMGVKGKNNGAVLFVFVADKKAYIAVGYGLEGALPDATCKRIIDEAITPAFATGNYEAGLRAGVAGILAAADGEFKGNGHTAAEDDRGLMTLIISAAAVIVLIGVVLFGIHNFGGTFYQNHVRSLTFAENCYMFFLNILLNVLFSGGSSGSGGSSASSGGGSSGGGGAGGSW